MVDIQEARANQWGYIPLSQQKKDWDESIIYPPKNCLYDMGLIFLLVFSVAVILGITSRQFLGNDNPVEEASEELIDEYTGIEVDLSPGSPEK
jgi:hypothetical protein